MKVKKLNAKAKLPERAHSADAGFDLFALKENWATKGSFKVVGQYGTVPERILVDTGIAVAIPEGYVGIIKSRSSIAFQGYDVVAGVIDADYRGEVKVMLTGDFSVNDIWPNAMSRKIAQMVVVPIYDGLVEEVAELDETERGSGGFGSTGKD